MKYRSSAQILTALTLALAAGVAAPALAQPSENPVRLSDAAASTPDFRSAHWLSDRKVVNNNGEEIAAVSDLILDRGSGYVEYVVLKTGTTLGMGGRAVAIPFGSFRWESGGKDRLILASTAEQLKLFPEYTPESWKAMKESAKDEKNSLRQRLAADAAASNDPYAGTLDTAKPARVEGEITRVERIRTSTFGEQVIITVKAADGTSSKIALGPSWYVNGASAAPMRGDKVVVDTLALPRDADQLLVGTEYRHGERELKLRGTDGGPAWALEAIESDGRSYSTPYSRFLLLSSLPGSKIDCRGNDCGKVNDIILDRNSGEVAFISIDPNQNFLGISDTKRLVPWSVATVTLDGTVRIDASEEMVLASPETPADLSTLNSGFADRVYKAFDVPALRFEAHKPVSILPTDPSTAWTARGAVITGIESNSAKTWTGKVSEITEVQFDGGIQPARALRLRTTDDATQDQLILLGPASYMDNQKLTFGDGDSVKVEAVRTIINGQGYWIARSVDGKGAHVVLIEGSKNTPAWAKP